MQVPIAEGKSQFAELVRKAEAGEKIVITRHGRVVAELVGAVPAPTQSLIGALKGKIIIEDDFDDVPHAFSEALEAPIDPPR